MESNPISNESHETKFRNLNEAVAFIKDFWMAIDPHPHGIGQRLAKYAPEDFLSEREQTSGDRTVLQEKADGSLVVSIYGNTGKLSEKAVSFLKSRPAMKN